MNIQKLLEGSTKACAKYLGGLHHYNNGCTAEQSVTAIDKAWKNVALLDLVYSSQVSGHRRRL
eukprot:7803049-Pyramimonas_sp.AAC.1